MAKKDRQYNGQKGETIQWPKRIDNTTAKKDRQYNDRIGETMIYKILHQQLRYGNTNPIKTRNELQQFLLHR
jgi:hypothetical protein